MTGHPIGLAPHTVPTVGGLTAPIEETTTLFIGNLVVTSGPKTIMGRDSFVTLTRNQAESLLYDLARRLGRTVS